MTQCEAMYLDNRAEPRFACQVRVVGASTTAFQGIVRDVSLSGLCLHTQTPIEPGRQLYLDFELPTGRVEAVGEVRRVTSGDDGSLELGIRFVRISAESTGFIRGATEELDLQRGH
jgi:hypothetical protein